MCGSGVNMVLELSMVYGSVQYNLNSAKRIICEAVHSVLI